MDRRVIISEGQASELAERLKMTEFKFYSNVKDFIRKLLMDPIGAAPSKTLASYGLDRKGLLGLLIGRGIVQSKQRIVDKDDEGRPTTAVMRVKYMAPRKGFDRRLKKLYISLFERNVPEGEELTEDGGTGCAEASGAFEAPMGDVQRRSLPYSDGLGESTTISSVGNFQYDVPMSTKKKTDPALKRGTGKGGSNSVEVVGDPRRSK